jgi:hypothetical protein
MNPNIPNQQVPGTNSYATDPRYQQQQQQQQQLSNQQHQSYYPMQYNQSQYPPISFPQQNQYYQGTMPGSSMPNSSASMQTNSSSIPNPGAMSYSTPMMGSTTPQMSQQQYQQALYQQRQMQQSMNPSATTTNPGSAMNATSTMKAQPYPSQTVRSQSMQTGKLATGIQPKPAIQKPAQRPTFNPQQPIIQYNIPPSYTQNLQNSGILPPHNSGPSAKNTYSASTSRSMQAAEMHKSHSTLPTPTPVSSPAPMSTTGQAVGVIPQLSTTDVQKRLDESGELLKEWESMLNKSGKLST